MGDDFVYSPYLFIGQCMEIVGRTFMRITFNG